MTPRWLLPLAVAVAFAAAVTLLPLASAGPAGAAPPASGARPAGNATLGQNGAIVIPGKALLFVGYYVWTGVWEAASEGQHVFAGGLSVLAYGLTSSNFTLTMGLFIQGAGFQDNTSVELGPELAPTVNLPFAAQQSWTKATLYVNGESVWYAYFAVPFSLIPLAGYDIGGLDLLVLAGLSLVLLSFTGMTLAARAVMKRVLTAPNFSLLIWGHVVIIAMAGAVVSNFQVVNTIFAGWTPLLYPLFLAPVWCFAMLHLFNRHKGAEILQLLARPEGRVGYRRWLLRVGKTPDGKTVVMRPSWWDFWARFWGHFTVVDDGDPLKMPHFEADAVRVYVHPAPKRRRSPADWPVLNPQDDRVEQLLWTLSEVPLKTSWPRVTIHKTLPAMPADPETGRPERPERRVLTWPHYTDGYAEWDLAPESFAMAAAVMARWAHARDLAAVLSKVKAELYLLKGAFSRKVEQAVAERLTALESALEETERDLSLEDARSLLNEAAKNADVLERNRKREVGL